jgi:hypothetical protein
MERSEETDKTDRKHDHRRLKRAKREAAAKQMRVENNSSD